MTSYLGIDLGTTSVKALLLGDDGVVQASYGVPYSTNRTAVGVEQDPAAWLDGVATTVAAVLGSGSGANVAGVCIVSQVNTHVLVDADLAPLAPAVTWQDQRAAAAAEALDQSLSDGDKQRLWGSPPSIDASFSLPRWQWWVNADPDVARRSRWMLSPKDFVVAQLTGVPSTDGFTPIGLVGGDGAYLDDVLALADGFAERQAPVRSFTDTAGVTNGTLGIPAGLPVAVGTMDAFGSVIGSGVLEAGMAFQVSGTSEIVGVAGAAPGSAEGVVSFPPLGDCFIQAGPTQAGAHAVSWISGVLGVSIPEALELAANARPTSDLLFLPHLDGERAPLWDSTARGVWLGMTNDTDRGELVLAVLEGVAFAARHIREVCEEATGVSPTTLRLSGGGSKSALWNTIKASTHGRPLEVLSSPDSGALGAAVLAAVGAGDDRSLTELARDLVSIDHIVDPDPGLVDGLNRRYGHYREAYRSLSPLFVAMAEGAQLPT